MRRRFLVIIAGLLTLASLGWFYQTFKYEPALSPIAGYHAQWLNPPPFYARVYYSVLNFGDIRPCEYTLAGWQNDVTLVFRWSCSNNNTGVIAHNLDTHHVQPLDGVPANLIVRPVAKLIALEWLRAEGVRPVGYESITRPLMAKGDGLLSPDGKYLALISRSIYGPEDVLVLSAKDGVSFSH